MRKRRARATTRHAVCACVAAAMLQGCGAPASGPATPPEPASVAAGDAPPSCFRQRTTAQYGSKRVTLDVAGGRFCIPAFGGFGGTFQYPSVNRSVELTVRTSTANIYDEPALGSGSPLLYVNLHFHAGTQFGTRFSDRRGLTGAAIEAGQPYSAFGIVTVGHLALMFPPCYTVAVRGRYGGIVRGLGELFAGTTVTGEGYGVIEIYAGEQTSTQC